MNVKKHGLEELDAMLDEFCAIASEAVEKVVEGTRNSFVKGLEMLDV